MLNILFKKVFFITLFDKSLKNIKTPNAYRTDGRLQYPLYVRTIVFLSIELIYVPIMCIESPTKARTSKSFFIKLDGGKLYTYHPPRCKQNK